MARVIQIKQTTDGRKVKTANSGVGTVVKVDGVTVGTVYRRTSSWHGQTLVAFTAQSITGFHVARVAGDAWFSRDYELTIERTRGSKMPKAEAVNALLRALGLVTPEELRSA